MLLLLYFSLPYCLSQKIPLVFQHFRYLTTLNISSAPLTMQPDTTSQVPSRQYNWVAYENCTTCNASQLFRADVIEVCKSEPIKCLKGRCQAQCGYFDVSLGENIIENLPIMLVYEASSGLQWYTDGVFVRFTQSLTISGGSAYSAFSGFLLSLSQDSNSSLHFLSSPPALAFSPPIPSNNPDLWIAPLRSVSVNYRSIDIYSTEVLFDSSGPAILMPSQDYIAIIKALFGDRENSTGEEIVLNCEDVGELPNLTIGIGEWDFEVPAESYFGTGVQEGQCQLLIGIERDPQSTPSWSLGYSFMWNFDILFNTSNHSISLTNWQATHHYHRSEGLPAWAIAVIVIGVVVLLAGSAFLAWYIWKRNRKAETPSEIEPYQVILDNPHASREYSVGGGSSA